MKTKVEPVGENEVELSVEVSSDEVQQAYERAISGLRQGLEIPGFRKGHVPRSMVVAHYGDNVVRAQTLEESIPRWGDAALRETGLYEDVVGTSEVDAGPLNMIADYSFSVRVQLMPTPELGEYKGLEVPKRKPEVTDEQVDAQLALLQERLATLRPVEDRPVQKDDFVLMDVKGTQGEEPLPDAEGTDQMFQVGHAQLLPGFEEQLEGLKQGEEKTFPLTFPADYQTKELAGTEATFTIKIKEIKEKIVPPLDDAFAADVSEFETLEALRGDARARMEAAAEEAAQREFRSAVADKAVDNARVSVPNAMIDREAHRMYHEMEEDIRARGISMEAYLNVIEKTREEAEEGMRPGAERLLKRRLVIDEIAKAEQLSVSDDEIIAAVKHDAEVMGGDYLKLLGDIRKAGRQEQLRAELLVVKTVDFLAEHAVPVEMTEADEAAAGEAGEAAAEATSTAAAGSEEQAASDEVTDADAAPVT